MVIKRIIQTNRKCYFVPRPINNLEKEYSIITKRLALKNKFEAETTLHAESFWQFTNSYDAQKWLINLKID
jgi:hypothetical protein